MWFICFLLTFFTDLILCLIILFILLAGCSFWAVALTVCRSQFDTSRLLLKTTHNRKNVTYTAQIIIKLRSSLLCKRFLYTQQLRNQIPFQWNSKQQCSMCAVMLQFQHKKQKLRKHRINKTKKSNEMANISIPVGNRVEFSKTICYIWFNQPKRNEAHTRTNGEDDKNKKGQENKHNQRTFSKKKKRGMAELR